jgi:lysine-N-methylase
MSEGFFELSPVELPSSSMIAPPPHAPGQELPPRVTQVPREFARPHYSERFQCIASACEDTCCQGWGVPIDQATFEKYRATDLLKPHIGTLIVLNSQEPTRTDYARMPLTNTGFCGFLDSERMCGIQKKLGAEMLSETCAVYPRSISAQGGQVEQALNLSCPEAARIALLEPHLLSGDAWSKRGLARYEGVRDWANKPLRSEDACLAVRQYCLLVLTDRSYPLWQRLYLLGILVRRLEVLAGDAPVTSWCEAHPAAVETLLSDSARVAGTGVVRAAMEEIEGHPAEQLQFVAAVLRLRIPGPPIPPRFIQCVQEFEAGLGCNTSDEAGILAAYAQGFEQYYRPLMDANPHLLENYLINHIFKNHYPFGRHKEKTTPEAEHLALTVHVATAQALLIGIANYQRQAFGVGHVVKLVQSLAKTMEHSKQYLEQIGEFVAEKSLNNLRGVALLVRQGT